MTYDRRQGIMNDSGSNKCVISVSCSDHDSSTCVVVENFCEGTVDISKDISSS